MTEEARAESQVAKAKPLLPRNWSVWSERVSLFILILIFVAKALIPAWRHLNTDFPNYYLGARLFRQGYPMDRAYEWTWFQRQKDHLAIDQRLVGFSGLTPFSILPVMPWCWLPPLQAKHAWLLMNLLFLALTAVLLKTSTRLNIQRILLFTFLAVLPLRQSFVLGQMHILVLLLLTFSAWLYFRKAFFFSGFLLAIAAAIKIYPVLFLLFFLFKRQWRASAGLVLGLAATGLISVQLFGGDACRLYVFQVLPWALRGEVIDPYDVTWNSFTALLRRLFVFEPELNPAPVAHLPSLYAFLQPTVHGVIFVVFMWLIGVKCGDARRKLEWATYCFLLLLLSSLPSSYHFVALILPAVLLEDYLLLREQTSRAFVVTCLYAMICGPLVHPHWVQATGWRSVLFFSRLASMVLLGTVLLWTLIKSSEGSLAARFNLRTSLQASSILVVVVAVGFILNLRHFRGQFRNYEKRVLIVPGSSLAMDPAVTSEGILFTALVPKYPSSVPNTYAVHELKAGSVLSFAAGEDWFHPAAVQDGYAAWAEVASSRGSRVVRFSTASRHAPVYDLTIEAEDAEQPIVSADGESFAFTRHANGRDSLWVQAAVSDRTDAASARQITDAQYDVRDAAFFPDHRIAFSSRREGRFRLYEVNLRSESVNEIPVPNCSARYPAISLDGKWIAYSCEHWGTWQIQVMNLETKVPVQLTDADCNSITPAWTKDSAELIYATDCGRGLGLTALARLNVFR
jgi:Glycosyltransferase family 87/WD40-like Beta Propeller Repeat